MPDLGFHEPEWPLPCVPTLYSPGSYPPVFDPCCAAVIAASSSASWDGRFGLSHTERIDLLNHLTSARWWSGRRVTLANLADFMREHESKSVMRRLPDRTRDFLVARLLNKALQEVGEEGTGPLDSLEWNGFLDHLEVLHLQYLHRVLLVQHRAFLGRGQPWGIQPRGGDSRVPRRMLKRAAGSAWDEELGLSSRAVLSTAKGKSVRQSYNGVQRPVLQLGQDADVLSQRHWLPPGWWEDLDYYSANHHPLHGLLARDRNNRLLRLERFGMELAAVGSAVCFSKSDDDWLEDYGRLLIEAFGRRACEAVMFVLPGMLMWHLIFFLFTRPSLRPSAPFQSLSCEWWRAQKCSHLGDLIGYAVMLAGICVLVVKLTEPPAASGSQANTTHLLMAIASRFLAYGISWLHMVAVPFNPVVAWGQSDPDGPLCLGDFIGLGRWRLEKQRFQARCAEVVEAAEPQAARAAQEQSPSALWSRPSQAVGLLES